MRGWSDLLIDGLLRKIGCKSCLSLIYAGPVDRFANQCTFERNRL